MKNKNKQKHVPTLKPLAEPLTHATRTPGIHQLCLYYMVLHYRHVPFKLGWY